MIDTAAIRKRILELAYQGNLSEQNETDGNVDFLYIDIRKFVANKELPEVDSTEYFTEIPSNWKWVRIGNIAKINPKNDKDDDENASFIPMALVTEGFQNRHNFVIKNWGDIKKGFNHLCEGDVGVAKITPCFQNRKSVIFSNLHNGFGACTTELVILRTREDLLLREYLLYFFKTEHFILKGIESFTGVVGQQRIHKDYLKMSPIPLPPVEEQRRIVKKIKESFELLDVIDDMQSQYQDNLEVLKSKIIDAGIQGKLTEQLPEDGTAGELLAQIAEERRHLVKQKKMKKGRQLPEITDDDKFMDIPDNWTWVRLGDISQIFGGKRIPAGRSLTTENTGHKYIRVSEMKNRTVLTDNLMYVPEDIYPSISRYIINKEDVYITVAGTIGRVGTIPDEIDGANLTENADRVVFSNLNKDWLVICLASSFVQKQITMVTTQVAQPKLAIKRIEELIIPLPPLAEQERIAAKIVETLALL